MSSISAAVTRLPNGFLMSCATVWATRIKLLDALSQLAVSFFELPLQLAQS